MTDSRHPQPGRSRGPQQPIKPLSTRHGRRLRSRLAGEAGTSMVEFVLVLPILLILLFGVIDFGKAFNFWLDESHLAGQGARLASVNTNPGSGSLQAYIKSQAETPEEQSGGGSSLSSALQVCISFPTNNQTATTMQVGDPVKVTINATYYWMTYIAGKTGVASSTISSSSTYRLEQSPTVYSAGCA